MAFGLGVGKAMMNAPGMGAIRKPLAAGMQKTPGLRGVGNKIGLGPSNMGGGAAQKMALQRQKMQQPPQAQMGASFGGMTPRAMNPQMQNAMQNAGNAIGGAFGMNRPRPEPIQMQAPPMMAPEPQMQEPDPQAIQAMQNLKQQQMAAMGQNIGAGIGGMFGGGGEGMRRTLPYQRDMGGGDMMQQGPNEDMDQMRRNKFMQMRAGGIGPRMGMGFGRMMNRPQPMEMQQQEPEMY